MTKEQWKESQRKLIHLQVLDVNNSEDDCIMVTAKVIETDTYIEFKTKISKE